MNSPEDTFFTNAKMSALVRRWLGSLRNSVVGLFHMQGLMIGDDIAADCNGNWAGRRDY